MLNRQQSTVARIQRSLSLKAGLGFGCQFIKSAPHLHSLHPHQQAVQQRAALLLGDPLDLRVAEARVQGLAVAQRLRSHLVGAGTYTHLETHLGLMAAVRTGVLKSVRTSDEYFSP